MSANNTHVCSLEIRYVTFTLSFHPIQKMYRPQGTQNPLEGLVSVFGTK
jgi:hypothetical protein